MRDEDVAQVVARAPRARELMRDALAAIDDVGHAVDDDQVRGLGAPGRDDPRPAARAEENEPRARACRLAERRAPRKGRRGSERRRAAQKTSACLEDPAPRAL